MKKEDSLIGKKAPAFKLQSADGEFVSLSDFKGKFVILYFYPRDNTPGCTKEACDFRDTQKNLNCKDAVVIGVSPDSTESHQKFRDKFGLKFELLSDPDREAAKLYGVYKKKNMYGKQVMGIERSTFVIDKTGKIREEFRKVKVDGHIQEVLKSIP